MNEPTPPPTPPIVRSVPSRDRPSQVAAEPRRPGRSSALIGGNLRPGMVPGGFSQELSRTSNAASDRRLASRHRKTRQPTPEQIRDTADHFLNTHRPAASPPPPPPDEPKLPTLPPIR